MLEKSYPRLVISGLSGNSGKTIVSCGLLDHFRERGYEISAFKKGPDYIDTAWLSIAAGKPARNLDTFLMGYPKVEESFLKNAYNTDLSIIEGNRGLFDGVDHKGTHSTAELAKALQAPVIIVQNMSKVTRTAAASILGCINMDPEVKVVGVILNQVAGERHINVAKSAIEESTGIPVIGTIPRLPEKLVLPSRHLGLITPQEFDLGKDIIKELRKVLDDNIDYDQVVQILRDDIYLEDRDFGSADQECHHPTDHLRIGYFEDQSFSFYYPENLEMLKDTGAEVIPVSAEENCDLEKLDALYIGGGFPETNLSKLTLNHDLMNCMKKLVEDGFPIYAECGGLIYLANTIEYEGRKHNLSGLLPICVKMNERPQGHGYCEAEVDTKNPFFEIGDIIRGHEFHYSAICDYDPDIITAFKVKRGVGCFNQRDGLTYNNVFASYLHIHALATPAWCRGLIRCANQYHESKKVKI
jgi:cobyrinic acid a,c-diamide synthase